MKKPVTFLLFCLVFWLGIAGLGTSHAETPTFVNPPYEATISSDGVQHVQIEGGSYFFKPERIIVKVNVPVELTVRLEKGLIPHTLVIEAPQAGISVDETLSSDAKNIRFTPTAVGNYRIYCKNKLLFLKSHHEKGMEAMLEVVQ